MNIRNSVNIYDRKVLHISQEDTKLIKNNPVTYKRIWVVCVNIYDKKVLHINENESELIKNNPVTLQKIEWFV